jgi:hypothetical protein
MQVNESIIAGFRPTRSPILPITTPPTGRIRKPAPNVASDNNRLDDGFRVGKNA